MTNSKEIILPVLFLATLAVSFWLWGYGVTSITSGEFDEYRRFLSPFATIIASAALFISASLLVKNTKLLSLTLFASGGILFFFIPYGIVPLGVALAGVLLLFLAVRAVRQETKLSLGFNITKISKASLPTYFTALSLFIALLYFNALPAENALSSLLPKSALEFTLEFLGEPLSSLTGLPSFKPTETIDQVLQKLVEKTLEGQGISTAELPKQELKRLIQSQRREFSEGFGVPLIGTERVGDIFHTIIISRLEEFLSPYRDYIPLLSAAGFFLALRALAVPLYYIALGATAILIKCMVWMKIVKKEKQMIEVEQLIF